MKSKTSCFNKTIFKKNITHFWPIWLIIMGWNLFVLPFMIYNSSLQYKMDNTMSAKQIEAARASDILSLVSVYTEPGMLFIFSVIAAMAVFSYLYNSRSANTIHALPVTRKELFITNYISGLLFLLVPEVIGFLTGTIVSAVCGYTSMNYLLTGLLFACGISFFFYSFTVLISMFTGQLFAVPIFALIINFLYVGCKFLFCGLTAIISYGMTGTFSNDVLDILSPLYYMTQNVTIDMDYSGEYAVSKGFIGSQVVAGYALVAVVLVIASYLVYRIRNMETAGSLISISWISPVFRWGVAFCGGSLFGVIFSGIFGVRSASQIFILLLIVSVIFGALCFFGAQMFLEKGFRVFSKKRVVECGVFVGLFAVLLIGIECDLFGQERKIPDTDEIKSAYINRSYPVGGENSEQIAEVLQIHSQIIDSKKEFEAFEAENGQTSWVSIRYYLKDGSVLDRSYTIPATDEMLEDTDSVYGKTAEITASPQAYLQNSFCVNYNEIKISQGSIDMYNDSGEYQCHEFTKEEADKLYQAVIADLEAGNYKNIIMNYMRSDDAYIQSTYCNTINFDFTSKNTIQNIYDEYNNYTSGYYSAASGRVGSACVEFDSECTNVISALKELGVIESEDELITFQERDAMDEIVE